MSTVRKTSRANKEQDEYLELIRQFPLRPIRSDAQLDEAVRVIDSLLDRPQLTRNQQDYLEVLGDLVESYESRELVMPRASDAEMLKHLIEAKGVSQATVAKATGITESTISEVMSGKRMLNRRHIGRLARYFHVNPAVFLFNE